MMQKTLRKVDIASMANGLEVRLPFLKKIFYRSIIDTKSISEPWTKQGKIIKAKSSSQKFIKK